VGVLGPQIYFQTTGQQTIRVQEREDGMSIDQIVLSPSTYLTNSPGALKNDNTILPKSSPPQSNQPPQVSINASATSGGAPLAVNFTSSASDPDGTIASYSWTFGNGNTSSQPNPANTYQATGTYTARLTVTDNQGATASAEIQITVASTAPPTVNLTAPNTNETLLSGLVYTITWTATGNSIVRHAIQLSRDGGATWSDVDSNVSGAARTYVWTVPFSPTKKGRIRVRAYDSQGRMGEDMSAANFIIIARRPRLSR
jgi:PKD repeat protein